ncbi:MAG: LysR family transcriptional regulator [Parvibaculales bacterium]
MDWDDLRFFLAVAGAGSLSAAAKQLNVNTTTVLRRIAHLEEALDARLFERLRSGYQLTQSGSRLREMLDPVDQNLSALERDFQAESEETGGLVKMSAGEVIGAQVLASGMEAFQARYPGVTLTLLIDQGLGWAGSSAAAPRIMNPLRDVDMTIRAARPTDGDMLMRKIGEMAYGLYSSDRHQQGIDVKSLARGELNGAKLIGFAEEEAPVGPVWWLSRVEKSGQVTARTSSATARMRMVENSAAIAALPCILADANPALTRVLGPAHVGAFELWLLVRKDLAKLSHVRTAMDFVIDQVQSKKPQLLG